MNEMEFSERPRHPGLLYKSNDAIMQLKYIQVQPGQKFHTSSRTLGLFKCIIFVEKKIFCWKELLVKTEAEEEEMPYSCPE